MVLVNFDSNSADEEDELNGHPAEHPQHAAGETERDTIAFRRFVRREARYLHNYNYHRKVPSLICVVYVLYYLLQV